MLIIFDLDDTLIDTSGCVTPFKLGDALKAMQAEGLHLSNFDDALDLLKRLNATSESARHALSEFLEIQGTQCSELLQVGIREVYENIPADLAIFPLEGALDILAKLSEDHHIALVTIGEFSRQMTKLKKAGIDCGIFSKIIVCEERNKKPHYEKIAQDLACPSSEVLVCGDRISVDLVPAKELGFLTVQMKWGRGLNTEGLRSYVDYTISDLSQLSDVISNLSISSSRNT